MKVILYAHETYAPQDWRSIGVDAIVLGCINPHNYILTEQAIETQLAKHKVIANGTPCFLSFPVGWNKDGDKTQTFHDWNDADGQYITYSNIRKYMSLAKSMGGFIGGGIDKEMYGTPTWKWPDAKASVIAKQAQGLVDAFREPFPQCTLLLHGYDCQEDDYPGYKKWRAGIRDYAIKSGPCVNGFQEFYGADAHTVANPNRRDTYKDRWPKWGLFPGIQLPNKHDDVPTPATDKRVTDIVAMMPKLTKLWDGIFVYSNKSPAVDPDDVANFKSIIKAISK